MLVFGISQIYAQTLPVGSPLLDDYYRRQQLMGKLDSTISFSIRPLTQQAIGIENIFWPDSTSERFAGHDGGIYYTANGEGMLQVLPVQWENQYTSAYPYSLNDGPMIPNVGFQTMLSAGIFAKYKFLSIQFRPEFVSAANKSYVDFGPEHAPNSWRLWYSYANNIDMPVRFGEGSYSKAFLGQSSIRLTFDPISFGVSTENLWWGPGMRNSLLMTNTAPGFLHATINTTKPIRTPIGSFEGQIIGGKLKASGYPPRALGNPAFSDIYYVPKPDDWRYISGMVLTYQPKWLPGLSLGLTRSFIIYRGDMGNSFSDYFPLFQPTSKSSVGNVEEDGRKRDQYASLFGRWVMPAAKAEIYAEYGRNDHAYNLRDYIMQPDHTRASVLGFRKLVDLNRPSGAMLQVNAEFTKLDMPKASMLRAGETWYTHYQVRDGYTNLGQILGSGVGPGGTMQNLNVSWVRGLQQIGLQFERYVHNNDLYYDISRDVRRNWIDFSGALHADWNYKNLLFSARFQYMHSFNYEYALEEKEGAKNMWDFDHQDKNNVQFQLGVSYRL
ncbi:hypothetical protein GCM10023231_11640 [Olivibacter ginsenosidimutans]|uniref:Capsule assembly Wzi family protein n=2 Tax=Olivibacter ginsenosidimutans TaxID=1176537 RepID=A0ABP9ASV7_9SPHI